MSLKEDYEKVRNFRFSQTLIQVCQWWSFAAATAWIISEIYKTHNEPAVYVFFGFGFFWAFFAMFNLLLEFFNSVIKK